MSIKQFLEKDQMLVEEPTERPDRVFLCRRRMARGDVLLTTPVLRALKNKYPNCHIYYETMYPELLWRNPLVVRVNDGPISSDHDCRMEYCNFELSYERYPGTHIIDLFAKGAGFRPGAVVKKLEMYPDTIHHRFADQNVTEKTVIVAPGPGRWIGRNWSEANWQTVCRHVMSKNRRVVLVGSETNYQLPNTVDLRGRTSYHQLAACIKKSCLFVGIDSFPMHVAGAMETPRVVLFGVTLSNLIMCDSPKTVVLQSEPTHEMTGFRHRVNSMLRIDDVCKRHNPMDTISVESVISAIDQQLA